MKKFLILIILVLILFACDKFDHEFYEPPIAKIDVSISQGYSPLEVSFYDVSILGSKPIEEWIWDFNGDGIPEQVYTSENNPDSVIFVFDIPNVYSSTLTINDGKSISIDTTYIEALGQSSPLADFSYIQPDYHQTLINFSDQSIPGTNDITIWEWDFNDDGEIDSFEQNPSYMFPTSGDFLVSLKVSDGDLDNSISKTITIIGKSVIVELFTGQWCPNCPNAEEALHNLRMQYGGRFSYVEYHYYDELESSFVADLFDYYPNNGGLPFGIVNGNEHILYSADSITEAQTEIEAAITPLLEEPLSILLTDLQTNLTDVSLSGSVQIEIDSSIIRDNLNLVAVLMEDYNDEYLNNHSEPHFNIALKRITVDISTINQSDTVEFVISDLDELPAWYSEVPEDLTLVIWVQTLETDYDEDTCEIYNVIEVPINN